MVKNLRLLREKHGLSQQSLAEKLGITQQAVYKYEKTSVEPDISTLMQLAELFSVSVDYLIGFSDNTNCSGKKTLSKDEADHLELWHKLPEEARIKQDEFIRCIVEQKKN